MDNTASSLTMLEHRGLRADAMWHALRAHLVHRHVPAEERLRVFYSTVAACFLYGCGLWRLDQRVRDSVCRREGRWLRQILAAPRPAAQDWVDWWRCANRQAHADRARMGHTSLLDRVLAATWGWHGHLARLQDSPAVEVSRWRDTSWWRAQQATFTNHTTAGRHPSSSWRRAPERMIAAYQPQWRFLAQDREAWRVEMRRWVTAMRDRWRGPQPPRDSRRLPADDAPPPQFWVDA